MVTGPQCRAARALVEVTRSKVAKRSGVPESTIASFEKKWAHPTAEEIKDIKVVLEQLGAVFLSEDSHGAGVRLKFTKSDAKQIARLEGEGGIIASNHVL